MTGYRIMVSHLTGLIGTVTLTELKVPDVDFALGTLAERLWTRSVRLARMTLIQAAPAPGPLKTTEVVYRLRPVARTAAIAPGPLFGGMPLSESMRKEKRRPKLTVRLPISLSTRQLGL